MSGSFVTIIYFFVRKISNAKDRTESNDAPR